MPIRCVAYSKNEIYYMRITVIILAIFFTKLITYSQTNEYSWDTITFETPCQYLFIDTSNQNIWQIGEPNKIFFDTAFSVPKAIITDTLNPYNINNNSFFEMYIGSFNVFMYPSIFLEIKHKFDTDTLKDGGYITVSYDNGQTWVNIIYDTLGVVCYTPYTPFYEELKENLYSDADTLFNGEYGFSGNSGSWITTKFGWTICLTKSMNVIGDTMIIRFNFISDSIQTNKEGWMIDNIRLYSISPIGGISYTKNLPFKIFPNPMNENTIIEFNEFHRKIEFKIFNIQGLLIAQRNYKNCQSFNLERNDLTPGIYFLSIKADNNLIGIKKLIIE